MSGITYLLGQYTGGLKFSDHKTQLLRTDPFAVKMTVEFLENSALTYLLGQYKGGLKFISPKNLINTYRSLRYKKKLNYYVPPCALQTRVRVSPRNFGPTTLLTGPTPASTTDTPSGGTAGKQVYIYYRQRHALWRHCRQTGFNLLSSKTRPLEALPANRFEWLLS